MLFSEFIQPPPQRQTFHTFDNYLGCALNHSKGGYSHTSVVGRLSNVGELKDVATNWHLFLPGQLHLTTNPLYIRHWSTNCNAGQIDLATWHHFMIGWGNGETGWHAAYCRSKEVWEGREKGLGCEWTTTLTSCLTGLVWMCSNCSDMSTNSQKQMVHKVRGNKLLKHRKQA